MLGAFQACKVLKINVFNYLYITYISEYTYLIEFILIQMALCSYI